MIPLQQIGTALVPMHGIASRHDLPLPFPLVLAGSGIALAVSVLLLWFAWRTPKLDRLHGRPLPRLGRLLDAPVFRFLIRLLVFGTWTIAAAALVAGQDRMTNPVFGFLFAWVWVGLVPLSVLFGPLWRATNPLRSVQGVLYRLLRRDPTRGFVNLPARLGVWPASVGLLAFIWFELVEPNRTTLATLQGWALFWLVATLGGALVFGSGWIAAADPFEAYASTVAELSPLRRVDGAWTLVNPLRGLMAAEPPAGAGAVVCVLLGGTAYDSFSNSSVWIGWVQSSTAPPELWGTGGLLAFVAIVSVCWLLATDGRPRRWAPTATPILVGYAIAHYFSLLVVEGQRTAIQFSDPLGLGWNLFGSAEMGVNAALFDHPVVTAIVQLAGILIGHVLGIVAAHEKAVQWGLGRARQLPMVAVMIFFTCSGLLLLFSP